MTNDSTALVVATPTEPKSHIVLTRTEGQRILIDGGRIIIKLNRARRGRARISIEAPRSVRIVREELLECP